MKCLIIPIIRLLCLLGLAGLPVAQAVESADPYANETMQQRDERMAWWREARFGMFIHWGVYAVPAGTYKGEQINGIGEWIMLRGKIPVAEYKAFAGEFNPVKYNPEAWAALAKQAGMRYIVITSKHHDGFALFPSAVTDWDVVDATPYGKDLIGPLADAARAEGLKFGLYYSQAQDWNHPGGAKWKMEDGDGWDDAHKGDFDTYLKEIAAPQVGEILARYRPDILWWDTQHLMTEARAERLLPLIRIVPGIIHNNRLGGGYEGDTETPEQQIPPTGYDDRDFEVCMTMNGTWGYKSYDHDWKSTEDLIEKLCDIVSKGGNFLLNVGPTAEGLIPQPSIERLQQVGAWMDVYSESIYGTTASPFHRLTWGRCTKKLHPGGATLYLHVFDWPEDGMLDVPGLINKVTSIQMLHNGQELTAKPLEGKYPGIVITVPAEAPNPMVSVIKLEIEGEPDVIAIMPEQDDSGTLQLTPAYAEMHNRYSRHFQMETKDGIINLGNWTDARMWLGWTYRIDRPGVFKVMADVALPEKTSLTYNLGGQPKTEAAIEATGSYDDFQVRELGTVEIAEAGVHTLELRGLQEGWNPVNVRSVTLVPLPAAEPEEVVIDGKTIQITKKKYEPTLRDVAYGPYERNKLDFWKAESSEPTPLVFHIHGGGWGAGSKEENKGPFLNLLKDGVSYVSINYRLARDGNTLPCSVHDAARALQFVRSKAKEWNIDPERIIATGGSAGGCSSLWLAYHDDLANPDSEDPVERQSSRICAAAVIIAQTTIDPWLVDKRVGPSASNHSMIWASVGAESLENLFANWDKYKALSIECSPLTHVSSDDPPVFMVYSADTPAPPERNGIHHVEFGRILKEKCDEQGLPCTIEIQGKETRQAALEKFMLETFGKAE